jgi:hypothetical protein
MIEFWAPLGRAWGRTKVLLFRPFDPRRWVVIAFCAWVAYLLDGFSGHPRGGGHWSPGGGDDGDMDVEGLLGALTAAWAGIVAAWEWVLGNWGATLVVFLGIPLVIAAILALVWVTSRFKFVYLDNVVRQTALVVEPWRRLGALGDSLFLFRVGFGLAVMVAGAVLVALLVMLGILAFGQSTRGLSIAGLLVAGMVFAVYAVGVVYAYLFLNSFVVPIMYRHNLAAMAAWRAFLPWVGADPVNFLLYGLFVLLLFIAAGLAIGAVGLLTCCIAFVLLAIPYVGTLLLLPLLVAYRYFSVEFLAQFGPAFDVFAPASAVTAPPR